MSSQPKTVKQSLVTAACLIIWELLLACVLLFLAHNIQIALKADRLRRDAISTSDRIAILTPGSGTAISAHDRAAGRRAGAAAGRPGRKNE